VIWRITWLLLNNSAKLFYTVSVYPISLIVYWKINYRSSFSYVHFTCIWLQVGEYQGAYKVSYVFPLAQVISLLRFDIYFEICQFYLFFHFRYPRDCWRSMALRGFATLPSLRLFFLHTLPHLFDAFAAIHLQGFFNSCPSAPPCLRFIYPCLWVGSNFIFPSIIATI
jgi:hypothetical protein